MPQYYTDIVPGGRYAQDGKWQGNGIDIFAPRGTPVKAAYSGTVRFATMPNPQAPTGSIPMVYVQQDDGISYAIAHVAGLTNGHVNKGDTIGRIDDNNLAPAWQHADYVINPAGPFQGGIDARQWLRQIGANLSTVAGRSGGPSEMLQGQSPFRGSAIGDTGSLIGAGSYGQMGLQNASILGQSGDISDDSGGVSEVLQGLANEQFTPGKRVDFQNPLQGLPEAWADLIPFAIAAVIVAGGVGIIEQAESVRGTHSAAWMLAVLVILGVLIYRNGLAGQIADFLTKAGPSLEGLVKSGAGVGTTAPALAASGPPVVPSSSFVPNGSGGTGSALERGSLITSQGWGGIFGGRAAQVNFPYLGTPYNYNGQTVHQGVDLIPAGLNAPNGSQIHSTVAGTVAAVLSPAQSRTTGIGVIIRDTQGFYHHFYHTAGASVREGQSVQRGDTIATFGGDDHVHYEVRTTAGLGGQRFDPTPWLRGRQ